MPVTQTVDVDIIQYPEPKEDPSVPIGIWRAELSITGDATGGNAVITFNLPAKLLHSVEEWSYESTGGGSPSISWFTGEVISADSTKREFDLVQAAIEVTVEGTSIHASPSYMPSGFKYIAHPQVGQQPSLTMSKDNISGEISIFSAWGFLWDYRAKDIPGGPRRP